MNDVLLCARSVNLCFAIYQLYKVMSGLQLIMVPKVAKFPWQHTDRKYGAAFPVQMKSCQTSKFYSSGFYEGLCTNEWWNIRGIYEWQVIYSDAFGGKLHVKKNIWYFLFVRDVLHPLLIWGGMLGCSSSHISCISHLYNFFRRHH